MSAYSLIEPGETPRQQRTGRAGADPHGRPERSTSPRLYELTDEWARIQAIIDDAEGEIPADLEAEIDKLSDQLVTKAEGVCKLLAVLEHRMAACEAEAKRLSTLAAVHRNKHAWLKAYLKSCLEQGGLKNLSTPLFSLTVYRNSQPSIEYTGDVAKLQPDLRRIVVTPDGAAARERYREFGQLPEGWVVNHGSHLRIK